MSRKINFDGREWAAHAQDHWLDFAGNPNFPDYLRIVFVAYGRHAANGHAKLGKGELSRFLVRKGGTLPDRRTIRHAVDKAIGHGYLRPESRILCLVVMADHVQGGVGDPDRRCDRDHTMREANDANRERRFASNDVHQTGRSNPNDASRSRHLTLAPSLSSSDSATQSPEVA